MPGTRLDRKLLSAIAEKTEKSEQYIREQISRRASRLGISSEATQILWAKEFGIGTARFHRSLPPHIQQQVRDLLPSVFASQRGARKPKVSRERAHQARRQDPTLAAIEYLLRDDELKNRCTDLLRARGNFDRVFREATTVLDDRLKRLAGIKRRINPADLAAQVLHPRKAILRVSRDGDEQEGFFLICRGLFLAFRNPTHHQLSDRFTREDALRFCGFVDSLLTVLEQAQKDS